MRILLDANAVLRYLLNDNAEMAATAKSAIEYGAYLLPEVLAEVVYVLCGVYAVPRADVASRLASFIDEVDCENRDVLRNALTMFGTRKIDFVDCILAAYHAVCGDSILTFDKELKKILNAPPDV